MIPWCRVCGTRRMPLIEDGSCGWCGQSLWRAGPESSWPEDAKPADSVEAAIREVLVTSAVRAGLSVEDLLARRRSPHLDRVRRQAMCKAREIPGASYPAIGRVFQRHHSTVVSVVRGRRRPVTEIERVRA